MDVIRKNGADVAINYQTEDFVEIVKRETNGRGADLIYDPVGGDVGQRSTKCIAFEGRLLIVGFTSGAFSNFVSNHILIKNYAVVGVHWGSTGNTTLPRSHTPGKHSGTCTMPASSSRSSGAAYPMQEVAEAMESLASRSAVGKIVLHW